MDTKFIDIKDIPIGSKVGTACVLIDGESGKFYLSKRLGKFETNKYCCPGGMVEENEMCDEAISRELFEETGLQYPPNAFKYITVACHNGAKSDYTIWFKLSLNDGHELPKNIEPDKHEDWQLYTIDEANKLPLMLSTYDLINYKL